MVERGSPSERAHDARAEDTIVEASAGGAAAGTSETSRRDIVEGVRYCVKVFLATRVGLFLLALIATALLPANGPADVPGWPAPPLTGGWHNLFTAWERWDALWFLRIADAGYAEGDLSAAFFPLYPLLTRGVSILVGGHPLAAGLIVANLCGLGALIVIYRLTLLEFGRPDIARLTVVLLSVFPTSFFLVAPYSESLFLLLSAGAFLAARTGRWPIAGLAAAGAAATRSIGVVLVLPLLIEAVIVWLRSEPRRTRDLLWSAGWSMVGVAGTLSYLLYWQLRTGEALTPLSDQHGWLREPAAFWVTLWNGAREGFRFIGVYSGGYHQLDLVLVAIGLVALLWVVWKARVPYAVYALLSFLIPLSLVFAGRPFMSVPRFLVVMFPLFWGLARFAERFGARDLLVGGFAALLGAMTVLFVNWYFVF